MHYISEQEIRKALVAQLNRPTKTNALVLEELGIHHGASRIDVARIGKFFEGYEIKSDFDTFHRFESQFIHYVSVFDRITIVVGEKHEKEAVKTTPLWCGIYVANRNPQGVITFKRTRIAAKNPLQDSGALLRLLWKEEAISFLQDFRRNSEVPINQARKSEIYDFLKSAASPKVIRIQVLKRLKSRGNWITDQKPSIAVGYWPPASKKISYRDLQALCCNLE
jgi:hypothetical protein